MLLKGHHLYWGRHAAFVSLHSKSNVITLLSGQCIPSVASQGAGQAHPKSTVQPSCSCQGQEEIPLPWGVLGSTRVR